MDYRLMFKGDYISAVEFGAAVPTVKIASVRLCKMDDEKTGKQKDKCVVFFEGKDRGWVICRTNAVCLAGMFGNDTEKWVGRRVTIYAAQVRFGKETVPGIRVKGSPDLEHPVDVTVKLPRKKPMTMRMEVTGKSSAKPAAEANTAPPLKPDPEPPNEETAAAAEAYLDSQGSESSEEERIEF